MGRTGSRQAGRQGRVATDWRVEAVLVSWVGRREGRRGRGWEGERKVSERGRGPIVVTLRVFAF